MSVAPLIVNNTDMDIPPIIASAFELGNGQNIIIYTSNGDITSYRCNRNWNQEEKPYATGIVVREKWPTDVDYHKQIRQKHGSEDLVLAYSTPIED